MKTLTAHSGAPILLIRLLFYRTFFVMFLVQLDNFPNYLVKLLESINGRNRTFFFMYKTLIFVYLNKFFGSWVPYKSQSTSLLLKNLHLRETESMPAVSAIGLLLKLIPIKLCSGPGPAVVRIYFFVIVAAFQTRLNLPGLLGLHNGRTGQFG